MKKMKLSTQLVLAAGALLLIFCAANFALLFFAQNQQANQEMDQLLNNESLALSVLVNTSRDGKFDFEISPELMSRYRQQNKNGFFRYIELHPQKILRESDHVPLFDCQNGSTNTYQSVLLAGIHYRIETYLFHPDRDNEYGGALAPNTPLVCLITAIDEAPYRAMVLKTTLSLAPLLGALILLFMAVLFLLVQKLTSDLSLLDKALSTANFSATHAFPKLPLATSREVNAVIDKLLVLHSQAAGVYQEMWLFLGRAAHQIKTPVTAMQTTIEVLLRKERSKAELLAGLEDVHSAATILSALTKKLISSSRASFQEAPPLEAIDLAHFFEELFARFQMLAKERGASLEMISTDSLQVNGNRLLMFDIFGNLIENAIQYATKASTSRISIAWTRSENRALITFADQGPGLPPEIVASLFQPFTRGDEQMIEGSGLGLSIVQQSTHLLGGVLTLKSSDANGMVMEVALPLAT
jgi:signal transduction histidine kinase